MNNTIYLWQNFSPIDEVKFVDELPEDFDVEHQADLVLALLSGHLSGNVFREIADKLGIDRNTLSTICDTAYNKMFKEV